MQQRHLFDNCQSRQRPKAFPSAFAKQRKRLRMLVAAIGVAVTATALMRA